MNYKGIQHVFFDLDHTLWDFDKNSKLAYQQIFEEEKVSLEIDKFIAIYEPLNLKFWRLYRNNEISKEALRYQRLKTAFDACNFTVIDSDIDRFADLYIKYLPNHNHLFEGCIELLENLKNQYSLHCITNGFEEVQQLKMERSDLSKYFDVILTAEAAGVKKPDPKIFQQAMELAGAQAQNSLMIGDSWEADISGAREVGIRAIYFNPAMTSDHKSGQVQYLKEINSLLI